MTNEQKPNSKNHKLLHPNTQSDAVPKPAPDWTIYGFRLQSVIVAVLVFCLYINTLGNGSAFDDKLVITGNEYVQMGVAGIPKILTSETYESFSKQQKIGNPLTGGRYRPLSIVTFAIEQQLLGTNAVAPKGPKVTAAEYKQQQARQESDMHLRHGVNMLLYMLLGIVLLYLFRTLIFVQSPMAALLATLCFMAHPLHTEVVANVKSRDEILSLLFICGTILYTFRAETSGKVRDKIWMAASFFLALLSKEYAVMLLALVPIMLFVLKQYDLKKAVRAIAPLAIPLLVYIAMRFVSVSAATEYAGEEIMNNPYLYATTAGKWATIVFVLLKYLALLVWPAHLTSDYSFNQIPYTNFSDPLVLVSIAIYAAMLVAGFLLIKKRHIAGVAIAIYLLFLFPVSNIVLNIGAPMGERLLFHASLGMCIFLGWGIQKLWDMEQNRQTVRYAVLSGVGIILVLSGFKTISRNRDWASDATLFLQDVKTSPNSIITNCNAGAAMLDKADATTDTTLTRNFLASGIGYLTKTITLHPRYMLAYINRGIIYLRQHDYEHALSDCDTVNKYYPMHPSLAYLSYVLSDHYCQLGLQFGRAGNTSEALENFRKAVQAMPGDADLWYNLGYAYFVAGDMENAHKAFVRTLSIKPGHAQARTMMGKLPNK